MNTIKITETFGASKISYVPRTTANGTSWVDAFVDNEPEALIGGDDIAIVRRMVYARIRREAR